MRPINVLCDKRSRYEPHQPGRVICAGLCLMGAVYFIFRSA